MAVTSMMQRLLDNALTAKFAKSLNHSDLPEGWADNPEIVQLAEDAYSVMGTESPWFKAWFGNSKVVDEAGEPLEVYHGTMGKAFDTFDKDYIGSRFSFDDTGFFFDSNRNVARSYARDEFNPKKVGHIIPAYIRANNPLIIDNKFLKKEGMGPLLKEQDPIEFWDTYQDFALDAAQNKRANGIIVDDGDTKMVVAYEPTDIKHATRNRGTFNPADPNIYKGLIPAVGAGGLLALLDAEEAEAAVRPDIEDVISKAIKGQEWAGRKAGNLESPVAQEALAGSAKYKGGDGYFTEHGLTWRNKNNGWTPAQIAEGYRGIYDSQDTVVVPNVLGVNPSASEALWNPNGIDGHSWYMPIAPYKKGFKGVTIYGPEASQVERLLKDKGYWEGGSTSSIFTPTLGERSKSIGSGTLPAVNNPAFETTIRGLDAWSKQNLPKVAGAATGTSIPFLTPEQVEAERARYAQLEKEQALQAPTFDPVEMLLAPIGVAGVLPKVATAAAEPFISYGMDKAINGILGLFYGDEEGR